MMEEGDRHSPRSLASLFLVALLGYVLLAVHGSFVPYGFVPLPLDEALSRVTTALTTMPGRVPRIDFVSNVILFLPFGFLLTGYLALRQSRMPGGIIDVWLTLMACLVFSTAIEAAQVFFPVRRVSPTDIIGETAGGLVGAGAWLLSGTCIGRALDARHTDGQSRALARLLFVSYVVLYAASQLLPFDITLEPSELAQKFRAGGIVLVPFTAAHVSAGDAVASAVVAALAAAPLGALLVWIARRRQRATAVALGVLLVGAVEAAQILVASRVADTTDVLFGAIGILVGAWLASALTTEGSAPERPRVDRRWPVMLAGLVWTLGVAMSEWRPFDFSSDPDLVARHWAAFGAMPFVSYWASSEWNALVNLVQKLPPIVALGFLIGLGLRLDQIRSSARIAGAILVTTFVLTAVEIGQVYLPGRVPDVTDVIVGTICASLAIGLMTSRRS